MKRISRELSLTSHCSAMSLVHHVEHVLPWTFLVPLIDLADDEDLPIAMPKL